MDIRAQPIKSTADFLLYLFQERKLQPSTVGGYGSAMAYKLGNAPTNITKDENLVSWTSTTETGLTASWNISLVVYQLTKAPFEPPKKGLLGALEFQDCLA